MSEIFKIKEADPKSLSHPKATIRADFSEFCESDKISILSELNSGSFEMHDHVFKNEVRDLYDAMESEAFFEFLKGSNIKDLKIEQDKKDEAQQIFEDNWQDLKSLVSKIEEQVQEYCNENESSRFWEDIKQELDNLFADQVGAFWFVSGEGMGWRKLSGFKIAKITDSDSFLRILPDTDCTFYVTKEDDGSLSVVNYHHDSPTGESYSLYCITPKYILEKYREKDENFDISEFIEALNGSHSLFEKDKKTSLDIFKELMIQDKSSDVSSLLDLAGPNSAEEAIECLTLAIEHDSSSAFRTYVKDASLLLNFKRRKPIFEKLLPIAMNKQTYEIIEIIKDGLDEEQA